MARKRQSFSKDFKAKVILDALREESTIQEIAVKHGVHPNQVLQWKASVLVEGQRVRQYVVPPIKSQRTSRLSKILNSWQSKLLLQETLVYIYQSSFVHQNLFCR